MSYRRLYAPALLVAALSIAALSSGCSDDPAPTSSSTTGSGGSGGAGGEGGSGGEAGAGGSGGAGGAGGSGGGSAAIQWESCPADFLKECATVSLPLDPSKPDGETTPIFISRALAQSGAGKTQVWLLAGGPGGSGNSFKGLVEQALGPTFPDADFYILEHRGVGLSDRVGCAAGEANASEGGPNITQNEWPDCLEAIKASHGDSLMHFTTTNDAKDLGALIELTREPTKKVFVFGVSYGTTRAIRFLQVHPAAVDGVILDSVVSPGVQFLSDFDLQYDPVAQSLSALCAADAVCGQKLGPDPWMKINDLVTQLNGGHCSALGMSAVTLRSLAPLFVMARGIRAHLFPLVYRILRCDPGDVTVVQTYVQTLLGLLQGGGAQPLRTSAALQLHVAFSEMWEEPAPTAAELTAECESQIFCPGFGANAGPLYAGWPRYTPDQYANQWPTSQTPVLALNGTLDPQTPIETAKAAADHFKAPGQTFVEVPWSPHGVVFESPVKTAGSPPCGLQMMMGFVADPKAPVDTACLADLKPVSWDEDPAIVQQFFGTSDMWENMMPLAPKKPASIDWAAVERAAREKTRPR